MTSHELVRAPQQARSARSFDRALDAAVALLVERGTPSFTLVEVSRAAGVSTGSMYGRVASKHDLIRVAHAREMERLSAETAVVFAGVAGTDDLTERVRRAVEALVGLLQRWAPVLSPFMRMAHHDDVVAGQGKAAFDAMVDLFERAMTGPEPGGPARQEAVRWSCTVVYSVLARQLALGNDAGAAAPYALEEVVDRLVAVVTAYLGDPTHG